jgi:biotin transport system substrate-specific component
MALIFGGSLILALFAQVRIPLPFSPVPITGQTFAVLLLAAALGRRRGVASIAVYLAQGAIGLPFFAGGTAGLARLTGPTGGYLVGFLLAAYVVGALAERGFDRRWVSALPVFALGHALIYVCGVAWLSTFVGWPQALFTGLWPFIPLDVVKVVLAALATPSAWHLLKALPPGE